MTDIELLGGMALGFFLTVSILSYLLLDDNLLFRLGAYCLVGVSAGYLMAVMFNSVLIEQYLSPLLNSIPLLLLMLLLGGMLVVRILPRGSSVGSIPMAFLVGVGAAVVVGGSLTGTFIPQAMAAAEPSLFPIVSGVPDPWSMLENWCVLLGTLTTLAYFHFGARPQGGAAPAAGPVVSLIARVGKLFLAVTLGALYAGALISSLTILIERIYFLIQTILVFAMRSGA
jgi:hypothetical protein